MPMGWPRRLLVVWACALGGAPVAVQAQDWAPSKTVRIVVPIAGTTNDTLARLVAPKLAEALGQAVIVENRPGAGGNIGSAFVSKAEPDGHTLLVGYNGPLAINVALFDKMPYDPVRDLAPITLAVKASQYLVVHPGTGITSLADFIAKAKAAPAKSSYGSVALGSASHLTMEMLKSAAGFQMTHVPYRGAGPAITDLVAGTIQAGFFVPGNVQQFAKEGRLRLLASTGPKRFASTPDIPTVGETYKDFEATSWIGFLAPGATPAPIIDRYNREIIKILNQPDIRKRLLEMEFEMIASTPKQFGDWIQTEIGRWSVVVKSTGTKAE